MKSLSKFINESFYKTAIKKEVNVQIKTKQIDAYQIYTVEDTITTKNYDEFSAKIQELQANKLEGLMEICVGFKVMVFDEATDQVILNRIITLNQEFKDGKPAWTSMYSNDVIRDLDEAFLKRLAKELKKEWDTLVKIPFKLDANAHKNL